MLTPADIRNRTIKTTMGGYNKKDTDEFIASILESFEELNNENKKLKEQLASLSDGIQYYKNLEDNLQKALVLAEKTSEETKNAAKAEAANIVSIAKNEASDIVLKAQTEAEEITKSAKADVDKKVSEAKEKADNLNGRLSRLVSSFEKYKSEIKAIVEDQLEFIESEDYSPETPLYNEDDEKTTIISNVDNQTTELEDIIPTDENLNAVKNEGTLFEWTSVSDEDEENIIETEPDIDEIDSEDKNSIEDTVENIEDLTDLPIDKVSSENDEEIECSDSDNEVQELDDDIKIDNTIIANDTTTVSDDCNVEEDEYDDDKSNDNENTENDDIIVEHIMTTPTLDGVENADISNTVFPAFKPDKNSVSYLAEDQDTDQKTNTNSFTFIDLD